MIAAISVLMAVVLFALSGCKKDHPAQQQEALGTETPSPEPVSTPEPTKVPVPQNVEEAILYYEESPMDYEPVEHTSHPADAAPARYSLCDDGVWRSEENNGDGRAQIMITGDLLCQARQQEAALGEDGYDFSESFELVRGIFSEAELVVGNLEGIFCDSAPYMSEQSEVEGHPFLNAPPAFLRDLRGAGFDLLMLSNNHNCDAAVRGIYETLDRVDEYGFMHVGLYRNGNEKRYALCEIDGIKVGFLNYCGFYNDKDKHLNKTGRTKMLGTFSEKRFLRNLEAVKAAGAEYVIVYMHWGKEYEHEPTERELARAQQLADLGADLIIGSHPHVLQPYAVLESANGRKVPVIYSLGNFISHQKHSKNRDAAILRIVLERDPEGKVILSEKGYIPVHSFEYFMKLKYPVVPVTYPYNMGSTSEYLLKAYERITAVIGPELQAIETVSKSAE